MNKKKRWGLEYLEHGGCCVVKVVKSHCMLYYYGMKQPPTIVKQSAKDYIVDPRDNIIIECEAKGNPVPTFWWRRNGKFFNVEKDPRVTMRKRSGTLEISFRNGGKPEDYEGEYQCFAMNDFGTAISNKILLRVSKAPLWPKEVLEPVVLSEGSPLVLACNPPPGLPPPKTFWMDSKMMPIAQDARVSMGLNGDLYFSNVLSKDAATDYSCNARFLFTHTIQQKNPFILKVQTIRNIQESTPTFLSPSGTSSSKMVLRGEDLLLECIAAGVPTPRIKWIKKGGDLPEKKAKFESFNKTMRIVSVSDEDSGDYICMASNKIGSIRHTISVQVKAAPFWIHKPSNLVLAPNENGQLQCLASGNPKPSIQWLVNGEPIESALENPSRKVNDDAIIFSSVQIGTSAVYQCNASNEHGYLLANAFVNILDMAPRLLGPKNQLIKVIENTQAFLDCPFFGSPYPFVRWFKNGQGIAPNGGKYNLHENGTLEIRRVRREDQGTYSFVASNILGKAEDQVHLEVKGYPDPPQDLELSDLSALSVRLTWIPGDENNSPVTQFVVQYEEDRWKPGEWQNLSSYAGDQNSVKLDLSPFVNYQFRVIAINSVGQSQPSRPSARYQTSGASPFVYPTGLKGWGTRKTNMEITWQPLLDNQRNGPDLRYVVSWRRKDLEEEWNDITTTSTKHVVSDTDTYVPYEIKIQAVNDFGPGPESNIVIGYSGEDRPTEAPGNLRVSKLNSTKVNVNWIPVSAKSINGEFKEYRLYYWREASLVKDLKVNKDKKTKGFFSDVSQNSGVLEDLVPYSKYKMYMVVANNKFEGPHSSTVEFQTKEGLPGAPKFFKIVQRNTNTIHLEWNKPLEPNGILIGYTLQYKTVNGTQEGNLQVMSFFPNETDYTMRLPDRFTRFKFYLSARTQVGSGEVYAEESPHFTNEAPHVKIWNLTVDANSDYANVSWKHNFTVGSSAFVLESTLESNGSKKSVLFKTEPPIKLPGLIAGAKYRLRVYSHEQPRVTSEYVTFETSGEFWKEYGFWANFVITAYSTDQVDIATQGWFIGLMCAIALLILILLIVCFIKRSRGGKYPVRDKKDLPLDPVDHKDQDGSFDYHSDEDNKPLQGSQTSLDGNVKESDDSLVDYGEGGDGQFNEDGSFIGQYTVRKDKEETEGNESSEATSPVNAIYSLA
ncbi:hypothetical protein QTP70_009841 [Hemibagrus guttatus]|uniref:Neural cell adhesion molecule L1 n=1 Tax=Hemibagrus guttatus TaxID=175788 RepID=A0AAE0UN35_9TELE|nr:hypothetical protein QTP70_009841 [Hemibagrus guttatus]